MVGGNGLEHITPDFVRSRCYLDALIPTNKHCGIQISEFGICFGFRVYDFEFGWGGSGEGRVVGGNGLEPMTSAML
jgi:hypothetical protein